MKKVLTLFLVLCIFVSFSGCKKDDTTYTNTADLEGVLNIYSYNPDTLNPLFTKNSANVQMLSLIFDSLITCDKRQETVSMLAEKYTASNEAKLWKIDLKDNIKFHDGTFLSSKDVVATMKAIMESNGQSIYFENLSNVAEVSAGGHSVYFQLKSSQTNFINLLDIPIVKEADVHETENFSPVGTGRYIYSSRDNKTLYLKNNENWWGENIPIIKNISVKLMADKSTSAFAYDAKEIDAVTTDLSEWSRYSNSKENRIVEYPSGRFNFLKINKNRKPLSDKNFRQYLASLIDKERIFEEVLLSHGQITDTFLNPSWYLYKIPETVHEYEPQKTRDKIVESFGEPDKIKLEILVNRDNEIKMRTADIIKECFQYIGIKTEIKSVEWNEFLSLVESEKYDMYLGEIDFSCELNPYYVLGRDETFVPVMRELQKQTESEKRLEFYHKLQDMYSDDLPSIPLYYDANVMLYSSKIQGSVAPTRTSNYYSIHKWYITTQDK